MAGHLVGVVTAVVTTEFGLMYQDHVPAATLMLHVLPPGSPATSLQQLGLDRGALLSAGLPQHTINALYRAMAAHAGAGRRRACTWITAATA